MRVDKMGRKRKSLEEKSTTLMIRLDNKLLFALCEKSGIEFDRNALIIDDITKNNIIDEIKKILKNNVN